MGDVADAMLSGEICEGGCGKVNPRPVDGVPWRCRSCREDAPADPSPAEKAKPGRSERARAKASKGDPLPKWQLESPDPVVVRYHCKFCPRHFGIEAAVWDHLRDVHGVSLP